MCILHRALAEWEVWIMYHIAVVEDSQTDRERLLQCLHQYEEEKQLKFEITEFTDGEDLVTDYSAAYDLILMDIEMAFLNGMKAAEKVRELDENVAIIFITNAPQYAIKGYKVRALDYCLKPISYFSFAESLNQFFQHHKKEEKQYITISIRGGRMRLDVSKICYVEVQDHLLIYNTVDGRFIAKGTMHDAESQLNVDLFFRCNRCYLVNLEYVENYQGSDITIHGDTIQVSRSRRKQFLDVLNAHMNGGNR